MSDATWTPSGGGKETLIGAYVYAPTDPESGATLHFDADTGEAELVAADGVSTPLGPDLTIWLTAPE